MALLQISEPGQSPNPHQRRIAVGIDLGTTHSLVASVRTGVVFETATGVLLVAGVAAAVGAATAFSAVALSTTTCAVIAASAPIVPHVGERRVWDPPTTVQAWPPLPTSASLRWTAAGGW